MSSAPAWARRGPRSLSQRGRRRSCAQRAEAAEAKNAELASELAAAREQSAARHAEHAELAAELEAAQRACAEAAAARDREAEVGCSPSLANFASDKLSGSIVYWMHAHACYSCTDITMIGPIIS